MAIPALKTNGTWGDWASSINQGMTNMNLAKSKKLNTGSESLKTWKDKINFFISYVNTKKSKSFPLLQDEEDIQIWRNKINAVLDVC